MSKLRLRGSTSGYTEIQASAVAGDNIITLPTTSDGTILTADSSGNVNIDSGTLYVDAANNRVGVGTASPSAPLDVVASTSGAFAQNIRMRSGNDYGFVAFRSNDGTEDIAQIGVNRTGVGTGHLQFHTSGTERARIDSSGRLLVGTSSTSSSALLQVQGNSSSSTGEAILQLRVGLNNAGILNGDSLGSIQFSNSESTVSAVIEAVADANWNTTNDYPSRLMFSTTADAASSPTERMRVGSSTSSIYATAYVEVNSNRTASNIILFKVTSGATAVETGNDRFYVYGDGDVENSTGTYGQISDQKLKENIIDASSQWDDIKNLRVRNFNFRPDTNLPTHQQLGFVAQEVEAVSPGLVKTVPDLDEEGQELGTETKSVKTSIVYMKAVKALQEAMERIETLEAKVAVFEGV